MIGTYTLKDLLAVKTGSIENFGVENVAATLQRYVEQTRDMEVTALSELAEVTTDARRLWGASTSGNGEEFSDDVGKPSPIKPLVGSEVHFPVRRFSWAFGRSTLWDKTKTPADAAKALLAIQGQYEQRIMDEIKFAVFNNLNYTMRDMIDDTALSVRAFKYSDGTAVPMAPDGTTFAATHNHYLGTAGASLAVADIDGLITHVREHGLTGLALYCNGADIATLLALASTKFVAAQLEGINYLAATNTAVGNVDMSNDDLNNAFRGRWDGIPVYTRTWCPDNYYVVASLGAAEKPLVKRVLPNLNGLVTDGQGREGLILTDYYHALFGIAPWNRVAMAVLDGAHQTTYQAPTMVRAAGNL